MWKHEKQRVGFGRLLKSWNSGIWVCFLIIKALVLWGPGWGLHRRDLRKHCFIKLQATRHLFYSRLHQSLSLSQGCASCSLMILKVIKGEKALRSKIDWCKEPTHWKRPWCWERLREGGEGMTEDERLNGITDSVNTSWSKLRERVKDREALQPSAAVHGVAKNRKRLSDWTTGGSETDLTLGWLLMHRFSILDHL